MDIVILPGLDGTGALVAKIKTFFPPQHNIITIQYPSYLYRYEDLLTWTINQLPDDDYILVAESFSGPLAIMIASLEPDCLKGIVFVATFAKSPRKFPQFFTQIIKMIPIRSRPLMALAQPFLMGRWTNQEFTTRFTQALERVPVSTIAERLRQVRNVNVVEMLDSLTIPFVYLRAQHDRLVPPKMSRDFERSPGMIIEVEGPHFLLQSNFQASAKHIMDFADQLS